MTYKTVVVRRLILTIKTRDSRSYFRSNSMKLAQVYKMMKPPARHSKNVIIMVAGPPVKNPYTPPAIARNNAPQPMLVTVIGFFLERGFVPIM
jgi:hypothetical protein